MEKCTLAVLKLYLKVLQILAELVLVMLKCLFLLKKGRVPLWNIWYPILQFAVKYLSNRPTIKNEKCVRRAAANKVQFQMYLRLLKCHCLTTKKFLEMSFKLSRSNYFLLIISFTKESIEYLIPKAHKKFAEMS